MNEAVRAWCEPYFEKVELGILAKSRAIYFDHFSLNMTVIM